MRYIREQNGDRRMKSMDEITTGAFESEVNVNIGNKTYIIKRYFTGRRSVAEAINKVVINEVVRKTV